MAGMASHEKRMELTEHLAELRSRIMRSLLYLVVGAILAYQFFTPLSDILFKPLENEMKRLVTIRNSKAAKSEIADPASEAKRVLYPPPLHDPPTKAEVEQVYTALRWVYAHPLPPAATGFAFPNFYEAFTVRLRVSVVYGFILSTPLILWELAMFVLPALTPEERRPLRSLIPLSIALLISGVLVAYFTMFYAMAWFLSYLDDFPQGTTLLQNPSDYVIFFVKMMAAFGVAFQLPVVLMGGAYVGFITSKGLWRNWRWGVMIAALGGVFTPSNDLISMALMSIPLLILYFGSILLVWGVERSKARRKRGSA